VRTEAAPALRAETQAALDAVEQALRQTRSRVGADQVAAKGVRDIVTATDVAVEDAVRALLADAVDAAVVGEEDGGDIAEGAAYWIVDPICGTRNYASGIPLYCVNLALVEEGQVEVAVVGDPSTDEVLFAERGAGAWASAGGRTRRIGADAESRTIVIDDSHAAGLRRDQAARFVAAMIRADQWELRSLSSTLTLAYLAAGRVAGYVLFWTSAVHAGAGSLLAAEAGATVTDLEGRAWGIDSESLLAAPPPLHGELLDLVRAAGATP
jgi:myo-inositol-1(or 4)-monophosphatase